MKCTLQWKLVTYYNLVTVNVYSITWSLKEYVCGWKYNRNDDIPEDLDDYEDVDIGYIE